MTTPTKAAVANDLGEHCQIIIGNFGYLFDNKPLNQAAIHIRPQVGRSRDAVYISPSEHLSMRDYDYFSRVFMNDWRSGAGQIAYLVDDPTSKSRFYDSTGVDVHDVGRFSIVHDITANANGTSANTTALPLRAAGTYLYMGDLSAIYYSAAWGAAPTSAATSAAGNVTALVDDGQYVYGAVAGVGINRWTIGSASAGSLWNSGSTNYARLIWANRVIYAIDTAALYSFTAGGTRTQLFAPPTGWTPQDIAAKRGGAIDAPILMLATSGNRSAMWYWDGTAIHDYVQLPSGFVGLRLITYLGLAFVYGYRLNPDGSASPCAYYIQNDNLGFLGYFGTTQSNGNPTPNGVTTSANYAIDAYDNFVYFGVSTSAQEVWRYDIANGGLTRYHQTKTGTTNRISDLCIFQNGPWVSLLGSGLYSTRQTFTPTATLDTSDVHLGQPWASNLWVNLEDVFSSLAAGESVAVSYSTDQGTTWTQAGSAAITGTRQTYILSNTTSSVKNPYIRLRFTLTAGTSQATTPYLFSFALKASPVDPTGKVLEFDVACPDFQTMPNGEPDWQGASGAERIRNIEDLFDNQNVVSVIYMASNTTRAKNPTTLAMKVVDYDIAQHSSVGLGPNKGVEGTVHVVLRQAL